MEGKLHGRGAGSAHLVWDVQRLPKEDSRPVLKPPGALAVVVLAIEEDQFLRAAVLLVAAGGGSSREGEGLRWHASAGEETEARRGGLSSRPGARGCGLAERERASAGVAAGSSPKAGRAPPRLAKERSAAGSSPKAADGGCSPSGGDAAGRSGRSTDQGSHCGCVMRRHKGVVAPRRDQGAHVAQVSRGGWLEPENVHTAGSNPEAQRTSRQPQVENALPLHGAGGSTLTPIKQPPPNSETLRRHPSIQPAG